MMGMWMMMTVVLQATAKKREEHRHIKLIERARWRVVLCRGRAGGAGRADGGRGGGQERNLHPGKNRLLIGFAYRHREGLVCSGETRQGGQGEALPREALPGCQLVHLGRDPRHSSQPGLPEGAGRHQPAGHPEPPGGQEAGQAGQGDQQWGLLIPLWRLFSKTGAGATRSQDTIQSIHKWHFQPMVLIGAWTVFQISKAISFFYRIGEIPTWHICSIRLPWIGPVGHPLQVQKKSTPSLFTNSMPSMFLIWPHILSNCGLASRKEICCYEYGLPWSSGFRQFSNKFSRSFHRHNDLPAPDVESATDHKIESRLFETIHPPESLHIHKILILKFNSIQKFHQSPSGFFSFLFDGTYAVTSRIISETDSYF